MTDTPDDSSITTSLPDALAIKKSAVILRAINHKLRQQMLRLILQHGKMKVTEIFEQLFLEQSVASQHLAILRKAGFVKTKREGKFIWYSVNLQRLEQVQKVIDILI
ncbi:MAG: metalloregulator ArsR/SmtB family transcription factor [Chitinophagaceae bacterium]|nr:metalloregulator ArsR/SmtB family transcription factor [Chitinophagaceae bacterium]